MSDKTIYFGICKYDNKGRSCTISQNTWQLSWKGRSHQKVEIFINPSCGNNLSSYITIN